MKRWRKLWAAVRPNDAGEAIAAMIVATGTLLVIWGLATSTWFAIATALQPPIVAAEDASDLDLIAQRGMNLAAWAMVLITCASTIVGSLGLYLIFRTLQEAKRSADAAEAATRLSADAIQLTQRFGMAQTRAYVTIAEASIAVTPQRGLRVVLTISNSGQTPALFVKVALTVALREQIVSTRTEIFSQTKTIYLADLSSGASDTVTESFLVELTDQQISRLSYDVLTVVVRGKVAYDTVFEASLPSKFSFISKSQRLSDWNQPQRMARAPHEVFTVSEMRTIEFVSPKTGKKSSVKRGLLTKRHKK